MAKRLRMSYKTCVRTMVEAPVFGSVERCQTFEKESVGTEVVSLSASGRHEFKFT